MATDAWRRVHGPYRDRSAAPTPSRAVLELWTFGLVVALCGLLMASPAAAAGGVSVVATVDGNPLASSNESHPLRLPTTGPLQVALEVTNDSPSAIAIRTVELEGRVIGLSFYSFDTSVVLDVAPGSSSTLRYVLDPTGLEGEATGLIPGDLSLLDANHHVIATIGMMSDVRGSIVSVYGLFGLGLLVLTLMALFDVMVALARHRLPFKRFNRGLRFIVPGVGLGLVAMFSLSALRVWAPSGGHWIVMMIGFALASLLAGYITPTPALAPVLNTSSPAVIPVPEPQTISITLGAMPRESRDQPVWLTESDPPLPPASGPSSNPT